MGVQNPSQGNSTQQEGTGSANSQPAQNVTLSQGMAGLLGSNEPGGEPANKNGGDNPNGGENNKPTETKVPAWTSQLSKEISDNADTMKQLAKFNNISDLAKSYAELEGKIGASIIKPGKDAKAEEISAFYEKLGKPKDVNGYSLQDENAADLKQLAFDNNLTDEQLKGIYEGLKNAGLKTVEDMNAARQQMLKETDEALHKEYGAKYSEKIALIQRGIQKYGGVELGKMLDNAGLLYHPAVVKLFIQLGEQSAEAGSTSRGAGGGNDDYKTAAEGGYFHSSY